MNVTQNSDYLFLFQATMTNPNGDPDQENKPRMDYETRTLLVSDARRKRDCRDFLKLKGYQIFVDTLADKKVPMDKMFDSIVENWLNNQEKMKCLFSENIELQRRWTVCFGEGSEYKKVYDEKKNDKKLKDKVKEFNNLFLTEIIKRSLIDIRLFGSAMAVENVTKTFTGPVQMNWGYSLHPVELVKSNTITTIMNDDSSTFGKKYKVHYALVAHSGTINKYSASLTGMTENDREMFRRALVQGMLSNQTDSKQGQEPLVFLEVIYKPDFDGYLGDLRRFIKTTWKEPVRKLDEVALDFSELENIINNNKYIEKVIIWTNPLYTKKFKFNFNYVVEEDLLAPSGKI